NCSAHANFENASEDVLAERSMLECLAPLTSLQFIPPIAADHFQIAIGRALEHAFSVRPDRPLDEASSHPSELIGPGRLPHACAGRDCERDAVRKATHEAPRLVVLHDLHDVAG